MGVGRDGRVARAGCDSTGRVLDVGISPDTDARERGFARADGGLVQIEADRHGRGNSGGPSVAGVCEGETHIVVGDQHAGDDSAAAVEGVWLVTWECEVRAEIGSVEVCDRPRLNAPLICRPSACGWARDRCPFQDGTGDRCRHRLLGADRRGDGDPDRCVKPLHGNPPGRDIRGFNRNPFGTRSQTSLVPHQTRGHTGAAMSEGHRTVARAGRVSG